MSQNVLRNVTTGVLLSFFSGLIAQVPEGGIMINSDTGYSHVTKGRSTVEEVSVSGQSFNEALRITSMDDIFWIWDEHVRFNAISGIETGDKVLVAFYARTLSSEEENGEGKLVVSIGGGGGLQLLYPICIGNEWTEYYARTTCVNTVDPSNLYLSFNVGIDAQILEIGQVRFLNYKRNLDLEDLPITGIRYIGQDPGAPWRTDAEERINQIRKGGAEITVLDQQGQPLQGAVVNIEMIRHRFGFGSVIHAKLFRIDTTYRNKALELFNEVVFGNDLKWGTTYNPDAVTYAMGILDAHQIGIRGHNVIWPSFTACPDYLMNLKDDTAALRNEINLRIDNVTGFTKDRLLDWDVINEPITNRDLMDILGDNEMALWFKRVRRNDRGVKLYLNEFDILTDWGLFEEKQDYLFEIIEYIDSLGGNIEGIGLQGHFGLALTPINRLKEILDRYALLGKEIKITEHDVDTDQRGVQADYTRDFMTIVFSHPAAKSLLLWGFWEGRHWKPDAALYNSDWTLRPHGEVWNELVFNKWWTPPLDTVTDGMGKASLDGFLGDYRFTVSAGESERSGTFSMDHSFQSGYPNNIVISLDESIPIQPEITPTLLGFLCRGEIVTLQATQGEGLEYAWYKDDSLLTARTSSIVTGDPGSYRAKITKGAVEVESPPYEVEVRELPEAAIAVSGNLTFCAGNSVILEANKGDQMIYNWMKDDLLQDDSNWQLEVSETGIYRVITSDNGCSAISDPVIVEVLPATDHRCSTGLRNQIDITHVYPNPANKHLIIETGISNAYNIEITTPNGQQIFNEEMIGTTHQIDLSSFQKGIYFITIRSEDFVTTRKIIKL